MRYSELRARADAPPGSSWGLLGDLGTIARLGDEQVMAGVACIREGRTFNLDLPVDAFEPPLAWREPSTHHVFDPKPDQLDDYLDSYYLQNSSQVDGLRHVRSAEHGFYNGVDDEAIPGRDRRLGIEHWARRGIVGRGVLVDVERFLERDRGYGLDHEAGEPIPIGVVERAADSEAVRVRHGDILLLRTGWVEYYFGTATREARERLPADASCPGLLQERATLAWLWDHGVSLLAADNIAVEALPIVHDSPLFTSEPTGKLHSHLIPLLGMALGELWDLEELARACDRDGRYEMLVVCKPLYLRGGVGSPANAIAIR